MFTTRPVARQERRCDMRAGCTIQPGERYTRVAYPPWVLVMDDPYEPARPLGEWAVERYHGACQHDAAYG